jgi:predicted nuclease of predicted toxin-antitoxin system
MKRILLDQGLPLSAASILRRQGWDAVHARELAMQEAADVDILARAAADLRAPYSLWIETSRRPSP